MNRSFAGHYPAAQITLWVEHRCGMKNTVAARLDCASQCHTVLFEMQFEAELLTSRTNLISHSMTI